MIIYWEMFRNVLFFSKLAVNLKMIYITIDQIFYKLVEYRYIFKYKNLI